MSQYPYMPLWTDAYLGDTIHLTTIEHGAYMLLLMAMWRNGASLPNDDKLLCRYARMQSNQWRRVKPIIMEFFTVENGQIRQGRLTDEYVAVQQKSKRQSTKAKARWLKENKPDDATASSGHSPCNASYTHSHNHKEERKIPSVSRTLSINPLLEIWGEICVPAGLGKPRKVEGARRQKLLSRFKNDFGEDENAWRAFCQTIANSAFLTGAGDRGWKANLDWVLKPENINKIMEGNYDGNHQDQPKHGLNGVARPGKQRQEPAGFFKTAFRILDRDEKNRGIQAGPVYGDIDNGN